MTVLLESKPLPSLKNSPEAIHRFPFPFRTDSYGYSVNLVPAGQGEAGTYDEHLFDIDEHYLTEYRERRRILSEDHGRRYLTLPHMPDAQWGFLEMGMTFEEWHGPVPLAHPTGVFTRAKKFLMNLESDQSWQRLNWTFTLGPRLDTSPEAYYLWGRGKVVFADLPPAKPHLDEYWPDDVEGLAHSNTVTDENTLENTFFGLAFLHILSTATIDALRKVYPAGRFEARRFRPNILVDAGPEDFAENAWIGKTIAIGDEVRLSITGPCPRCVMTTLAQSNLPKDPGILRTAVQQNGANVGVYAEVVQSGRIKLGDTIRIPGRRIRPAIPTLPQRWPSPPGWKVLPRAKTLARPITKICTRTPTPSCWTKASPCCRARWMRP